MALLPLLAASLSLASPQSLIVIENGRFTAVPAGRVGPGDDILVRRDPRPPMNNTDVVLLTGVSVNNASVEEGGSLRLFESTVLGDFTVGDGASGDVSGGARVAGTTIVETGGRASIVGRVGAVLVEPGGMLALNHDAVVEGDAIIRGVARPDHEHPIRRSRVARDPAFADAG